MTETSQAAGRSEVSERTKRQLPAAALQLLTPATLALVIFFLVPLLWLLRMSFNRGGAGGIVESAFTLQNYLRFFTEPFYLQLAVRTLWLGLIVTVLALIVTYPIALFLVRTRTRWKGVLVALLVAPLLTSIVVRTYGWIVLLGSDGLVNSTLSSIGFVDTPLQLVNNQIGVIIGMVEILMPYMALGLLSGFGKFGPDMEEAAMSLGAGPLKTFWRVTLPLSIPGIATGCLLVFVLTISSFVTPQLLGGGRFFVMSTEIYEQATLTLDWPFGSALSFILLLIFGVIISVYLRVSRTIEQR